MDCVMQRKQAQWLMLLCLFLCRYVCCDTMTNKDRISEMSIYKRGKGRDKNL